LIGKCDKAVALCVLVSVEEAAVRDGVEEHQRISTAGQACCVRVYSQIHTARHHWIVRWGSELRRAGFARRPFF
jgi:hypothetical protein